MRRAILILLFVAPAARADGPDVHARLLKSTAWVRTTTQGVGTGWVVDAKRCWLVTNLHVVGEQDRVEAFFPVERDGRTVAERQFYLENQKQLHEDGRAVRGKVILRREASDLALIELEGLPKGFAALPLTDSLPGPGTEVHSVGNRHDADALWLHTTGTVRQVGRLTDGYFWRGKKLAAGAPCLIAQSPIQPGDSGGALVNDRCEVVGVLSGGRWQAQSAAIAIQVSEVRALLADAEKAEKSGRPADKKPPSTTKVYRQLLAATVWVRPTATEGRAAGFIVDRERRLVLTTATAVGPLDLVDVLFPAFRKGELIAETAAYDDRIGLRQSGRLVRGLVLARDPKRDLALVELDALPEPTGALALAADEPRPAEKVHALSHPSGVEMLWLYSAGTVRQGANIELVIATTGEPVKPRCLLLQIPHQGGPAGGPVVNERGEVVGMLAAKESAQQQLGYAIGAGELKVFVESARPLFAPRTAADYRRLGQLKFAIGQPGDGIKAYLKAVEPRIAMSAGDNQQTMHELTDAMLRHNEAAKYVSLVVECLGFLKKRPDDLARIAHAKALLGETKGLRASCDEILKQDNKIARAYLVRGLVSDDKEALADFDEAIFLDSKLVEAYRARATLHEKLGDDAKAVADYSRAIELDPYFPETIRRRAALHLKRSEPKRAIADYERLIDLLPRDAASYRGLAAAWLARDDEAKSIPALVGALRWEPAQLKDVLVDVLKHGDVIAKKWPDDPEKRIAWYQDTLKAFREWIKDEAVRRKIDDMLAAAKNNPDARTWADELHKRIAALAK